MWSAGSLFKKRSTMQAVGDLAVLPGPAYIWDDSQWIGVHPNVTTAADVAAWPFSVGMLVKIVAFLDSWRCLSC